MSGEVHSLSFQDLIEAVESMPQDDQSMLRELIPAEVHRPSCIPTAPAAPIQQAALTSETATSAARNLALYEGAGGAAAVFL
jgi:hypothetical protein